MEKECRCEQLLELGHMSLYYLQYDKAKVTMLWRSLAGDVIMPLS